MLTGGTLVLLAAFTPWALLRMLPLHEVASAAAGGLSHAPKHTLSSAADHALGFADGSSALGTAWLGRAAARDPDPALLEAGLGRRAADPATGAGPVSRADRRIPGRSPARCLRHPAASGLIGPGTAVVPSTAVRARARF